MLLFKWLFSVYFFLKQMEDCSACLRLEVVSIIKKGKCPIWDLYESRIKTLSVQCIMGFVFLLDLLSKYVLKSLVGICMQAQMFTDVSQHMKQYYQCCFLAKIHFSFQLCSNWEYKCGDDLFSSISAEQQKQIYLRNWLLFGGDRLVREITFFA